ncbi:MAG: hypothetical protein II720_05175 [Bacteroidales bacterium]|nr:hypothetical protein [Bacteroidales bacterium]
MIKFLHSTVLLLLAILPAAGQVVLENGRMRLELSENAQAVSLQCKDSGEECLAGSVPLCSITQYRPYDNENFLMMPAKPVTFPSNKLEYRDGQLFIQFEGTYDILVVDVRLDEDYIGFKPVRRDYLLEDMGVKRKTEIDEIALLQLDVKDRENFGSWLNVVWDSSSAVCLMGVDPKTRIDRFGRTMSAGLEHRVGLGGEGAVLVCSAKDAFLDVVDKVEADYGLPRGVQSRRNPRYNRSYYELRDVTPLNLDRHLEYARQGGFGAIVIYYPDFASTCGHFLWKDGFDMDVLKSICSRIRAAGFDLGFHIHYSKVSVTDPYICSGVPDKRLSFAASLLLADPAGADDTVLRVEGNPQGLRLEDGRRLLLIDDELVMYSRVSGKTLEGCTRGVYNTRPSAHPKGTLVRQPDVDDWPLFIRIDQDADIQGEIASRLAEIYRECGFNFVYFDGAEDVPYPYWYNVSRSQKAVYDLLDPAPIYAEGALKSHFGWHILSRGNAFDLFPADKIRQAMARYTLRCAQQLSMDFTSPDFGWVDYNARMQPDIYEFICSKAAAWGSPISLMGKLHEIDSHPRTADNLRVIRDWEEVKVGGKLSAQQVDMLRDPQREWTLVGGRIFEVTPLPDKGPVRGRIFVRDGRTCLMYWNMEGSGAFDIRLGGKVSLTDMDGKKVRYRRKGDICTLPCSGRMVLSTEMTPEELTEVFEKI